MSMTPDIKKRIDARCERQKYKDSDGKEGKLGLYIRVGTSTLYDWKPTYKSALKEIAYMTVDGDGIRVKPRDESRKKVDYNGWCWASELTLAKRLGCSERTVQRIVAKMKKDGVIEIRTLRDKWGHSHNEYQINEQVIDDNQRPDDGSRAKCEWKVRKPNKGTFSKTHQPKRGQEVDKPLAATTDSLQNCSKSVEPARHLVRDLPDTVSVEAVDVGRRGEAVALGRSTSTYPASQGSQTSSLRSKPENQNPTPKPTPAVTQPEVPPVVRREAFQTRLEYSQACYKAGVPPEPRKTLKELVHDSPVSVASKTPTPTPAAPLREDEICPVCGEYELDCLGHEKRKAATAASEGREHFEIEGGLRMKRPALARTTDPAEGVLREHECKCHALFAMLEDLQEHQETCETALAIDPEDAAEEEQMYAEDLIGYGEAPDPMPDFDPFAAEREGENWQ